METIRRLGLIVVGVLVAGAAFAGGGRETVRETPAAKPMVLVSILPQSYFVSRIAGERVNTVVMVNAGQSPHSWEPTPRQVADMARATIWFSIGVDFESALRPRLRSIYPALRVVDTTAGVTFRALEAHHHDGEDEDHGESGRDPHVWLGRAATKAMAVTIRDTLSEIDPSAARAYAENCDALLKDIDATFEKLAADLAPLRGETAFVYHPAFGYFLDEFGIRQEAVETGGKEPTQRQLAELIREAREDGARVIFVQSQFPADAARTVADAIGGSVAELDPLAPDWLDNIERMGDALRNAAR